MSNFIRHPYHLVDPSPWPILSAVAAMGLTNGFIQLFYYKTLNLFLWRTLLLILVAGQWWRDVVREATFYGCHTKSVQFGLRLGIVLFIISEVIFFFSFFWAFFHRRLSPRVELGSQWPPLGIQVFRPWGVPLINTFILLSRGVRVTWSHFSIIKGEWEDRFLSLIITILLGIYFTLIQLIEYMEAPFTISDSVYGRTFFITTGFHGFHVLVGTIFLIVSLYRLNDGHFRVVRHIGFEAAIWYWHFVDVVWIFLFITVYWWGGK